MVRRLDFPRDIHLDPLVSRYGDGRCPAELDRQPLPRATAHLHQLRQHNARRSRPYQQHLRAKGHLDLVHPVDGAAGRLEQCRLLVREVVDLEDLGVLASPSAAVLICRGDHSQCHILGEPSWPDDTLRLSRSPRGRRDGRAYLGGEVLAEQLFSLYAQL
jgi:hypothetical protein